MFLIRVPVSAVASILIHDVFFGPSLVAHIVRQMHMGSNSFAGRVSPASSSTLGASIAVPESLHFFCCMLMLCRCAALIVTVITMVICLARMIFAWIMARLVTSAHFNAMNPSMQDYSFASFSMSFCHDMPRYAH